MSKSKYQIEKLFQRYAYSWSHLVLHALSLSIPVFLVRAYHEYMQNYFGTYTNLHNNFCILKLHHTSIATSMHMLSLCFQCLYLVRQGINICVYICAQFMYFYIYKKDFFAQVQDNRQVKKGIEN